MLLCMYMHSLKGKGIYYTYMSMDMNIHNYGKTLNTHPSYCQPPLSYLGNGSEDIKKDFQVDIFSKRKFKNRSPCSLNPRS